MTSFATFALAYLVNALWQVPLLALAAWCAAFVSRSLGPRVEHRIWVVSLGLSCTLPACSFDLAQLFRVLRRMLLSHPDQHGARITVTTTVNHANGAIALSSNVLHSILVVYLTITAFFFARLLLGLLQAHRLRYSARPVILSSVIAEHWRDARRTFRVEEATLGESSRTDGPVTLGTLNRMLLLPGGWVEKVVPEDFAAAVAHECAHMHRHDYGKNLFYELLALPIAFHPVVRFLVIRISTTREMICDEAAARTLAGKQKYARSLLRLASLLATQPRNRNLHAVGIFDANNLETRIMNLTMKSVEVRTSRRLFTAAICLTLGFGTCAFALSLHINPTGPASRQETEAPTKPGTPMKVSGGVMAGNLLTRVPPVYPPDARSAGIQGPVVLHAVIGKAGSIENLSVVSGPRELQASAIDAVKQWIYKPFLLNGDATEVETTIIVNYSLQK